MTHDQVTVMDGARRQAAAAAADAFGLDLYRRLGADGQNLVFSPASIAAALQLALENPDVPGGTVLHAASGVETSVAELARLCATAAGRPDHPVEYRPARPGEVGRNFARYDLARELLGYWPAVPVSEGIPALWRWLVAEVFRN